jgi:raffinose/stachyose/melibiose transport system permease protein
LQHRGKRLSDAVQQAVFVGPALLFFGLIVLVPFLMSFYYSLTEWNGVTTRVDWAGFGNFKRILLEDTEFRNAFWFTARYTLAAVVFANAVGFTLALLLTQPLKTRNVLRTIFFLPNVIAGLLLGFIWSFIFVKGFAAVGEWTGIGFFKLPWLGTASTAFWGMVIVSVWQMAGYMMVIYIAAMMNMPRELIEAAKIDGAGRWQMLKSIILPLVMPAFTVCLFLTLSWSFKVFDLNLSLTKGGPFGSTESVALNIYKEAFQNNRYGLGTAKSLIFFLVVATVTTLQVIYTKRKEVEV